MEKLGHPSIDAKSIYANILELGFHWLEQTWALPIVWLEMCCLCFHHDRRDTEESQSQTYLTIVISTKIVDHIIIMIMSIQASTKLSTASSLISARDKRARKNTCTRARPEGHAFPSRRVSFESRGTGIFRLFSVKVDFDFRCSHYVANNKRPYDCD